MNRIETIIFDLGGVLVELDGKPIKNEWITDDHSHEDSWQMWLQSPTVQNFDRGLLDPEDFAKNIIDELSLDVSVENFLNWVTDWPKDFFNGSLAILDRLNPHYSLGVFSNITEIHWPRYYDVLHRQGCVSHYFASYQMGLAKPELPAFNYVIETLGDNPSSILFLDDNQLNVDAAITSGMQSICVKGIGDVQQVLEDRDLLFRN